jgi:two-component system sensor histidine kinase FlrB
MFNLASSDLCLAYEELRQQALVLTCELALANGELRRQFAEKEALRESVQRRERLAAMGEMAARLAHQLRTPLATALLYAAQLGETALPAAERARFAGKTVDRLHHLERLIEDMLLFVRGASTRCETVAASELLREAFQTMEPQVVARGLLIDVRDESAGCMLRVDRQALSGALLGLLENALQASSPGGSIRLAATVNGAELAFCVTDTGAGIAPEAQARLFEPFFTTRSGGSGLGLAIVQAVAEAHGGSIAMRSVLGAGSEFVLRLPLAPAAECGTSVIGQGLEPRLTELSSGGKKGLLDDIAATVDC